MDATTMTSESVHALVVFDGRGDTRHAWTPGNAAEEAAAKATFDALKAKGYIAYRVDEDERGAVVPAFDPSLGEILLVPPIVGG